MTGSTIGQTRGHSVLGKLGYPWVEISHRPPMDTADVRASDV